MRLSRKTAIPAALLSDEPSAWTAAPPLERLAATDSGGATEHHRHHRHHETMDVLEELGITGSVAASKSFPVATLGTAAKIKKNPVGLKCRADAFSPVRFRRFLFFNCDSMRAATRRGIDAQFWEANTAT